MVPVWIVSEIIAVGNVIKDVVVGALEPPLFTDVNENVYVVPGFKPVKFTDFATVVFTVFDTLGVIV